MSYALSLGTAQLGLDYGITNTNGKVVGEQATQILRSLKQHGFKYIDTAFGYGDSEQILGSHAKYIHDLKISTKLPSFSKSRRDISLSSFWDSSFQTSRSRLKALPIDTLYLHDIADFSPSNYGECCDWLLSKKDNNDFSRVGASIYCPDDLELIPLDLVDVIQLPVSLFNQTFLHSNLLPGLLHNGISLQARSIFMQGALLVKTDQLPPFFSDDFKSHHAHWIKRFDQAQTTALVESLSFIRDLGLFESSVVGVSTFREFLDISHASSLTARLGNEHSMISWAVDSDINPSNWPSAT